MDQLRKSVDKM